MANRLTPDWLRQGGSGPPTRATRTSSAPSARRNTHAISRDELLRRYPTNPVMPCSLEAFRQIITDQPQRPRSYDPITEAERHENSKGIGQVRVPFGRGRGRVRTDSGSERGPLPVGRSSTRFIPRHSASGPGDVEHQPRPHRQRPRSNADDDWRKNRPRPEEQLESFGGYRNSRDAALADSFGRARQPRERTGSSRYDDRSAFDADLWDDVNEQGDFDANGNFRPTRAQEAERAAAGAPAPPPGLRPSAPTLSLQDVKWVYLDDQFQKQGPFEGARMQDWFNNNYLRDDLILQRESDTMYTTLGAIRDISDAHKTNPFSLPVPDTLFNMPDPNINEAKRLEQERLEQQERLQQERLEQERLDRERQATAAAEAAAREEAERERKRLVEQEQQRLVEQERLQKQLEQQRAEQAWAEQERARVDREDLERERIRAEQEAKAKAAAAAQAAAVNIRPMGGDSPNLMPMDPAQAVLRERLSILEQQKTQLASERQELHRLAGQYQERMGMLKNMYHQVRAHLEAAQARQDANEIQQLHERATQISEQANQIRSQYTQLQERDDNILQRSRQLEEEEARLRMGTVSLPSSAAPARTPSPEPPASAPVGVSDSKSTAPVGQNPGEAAAAGEPTEKKAGGKSGPAKGKDKDAKVAAKGKDKDAKSTKTKAKAKVEKEEAKSSASASKSKFSLLDIQAEQMEASRQEQELRAKEEAERRAQDALVKTVSSKTTPTKARHSSWGAPPTPSSAASLRDIEEQEQRRLAERRKQEDVITQQHIAARNAALASAASQQATLPKGGWASNPGSAPSSPAAFNTKPKSLAEIAEEEEAALRKRQAQEQKRMQQLQQQQQAVAAATPRSPAPAKLPPSSGWAQKASAGGSRAWGGAAPVATTARPAAASAAAPKKAVKVHKDDADSFWMSAGQDSAATSGKPKGSKSSAAPVAAGMQVGTSLAQVQPSFLAWCKKELVKIVNTEVDPETFVSFLLDIGSTSEVIDYLSEMSSKPDQVRKFAHEFMKNRVSAMSGTVAKGIVKPKPPMDDSWEQQAKAKKKTKKKKQFQKLDNSLLGYNVTAGSAPNRGEIDFDYK